MKTITLNVLISSATKKRMDLVKAHTGESLASQAERALSKQSERDMARITKKAAKA